MASSADLEKATQRVRSNNFAGFVDRWIFVFMAALFTAIVLAGFVPSSIAKVAAVQSGARAPFPPILHVHAALMGSWMILLLLQTTLMATGQRAWHKQLGIAGFVIAPLMLIVGCVAVATIEGETLMIAVRLGQIPAEFVENVGSRLLLRQIRIGFCFAILVALALKVRRRDPELHKRLMILGTLAPIAAGIDRIPWKPQLFEIEPAAQNLFVLQADIYLLLAISPLFLWDLARSRRVHLAYAIFAVVFAIPSLAVYTMPGQSWWVEISSSILGLG